MAAEPGPRPLTADAGQADQIELDASLSAQPPRISPKFFYDRLGSILFTAICETPEYYPTRTEHAILQSQREQIAAAVGPACVLIDLGAGDCGKAASLLPALQASQYVAVDVSTEFLGESLKRLSAGFPDLPVSGIGMDFTRAFKLPVSVPAQRRLMFYPGSSIGNFTPPQAAAFLSLVRAEAGEGGGLLIGVDLAKAPAIVEPAYDDSLGITAAFNLNLLHNVNRILGSDFDPADWRHRAFLNVEQSRIEMHLVARRAVQVNWPGGGRRFEADQSIHTENSYKYSQPAFEAMLRSAGFDPQACWTDANHWFAIYYARVA